jgi:hypothetical protein
VVAKVVPAEELLQGLPTQVVVVVVTGMMAQANLEVLAL